MGGWSTGRNRKGEDRRSGWLTGCEASHITVASIPKSAPRWGWEGENGVGGLGDGEEGLNQKGKKKREKKGKKKGKKRVGVTIWWATRPV